MADKAKRAPWRIARTLIALLVFAAGVAAVVLAWTATSSPRAAEPTMEEVPSAFTDSLAWELSNSAEQVVNTSVNTAFESWFYAYAQSRVIAVDYADRLPQAFGPWTAEKDYGTEEAREDGSLTEWADSYYISHEWSDFGKQILSMIPGDVVTVNGTTFEVRGICNYPKDSYLDEVMCVAGYDSMVFQTCYPDSDMNRIVYGW